MNLFSVLLLCFAAQASPESEALWEAGKRLDALNAMAIELEQRPDDLKLRQSLVQRELELSRFQAALEHARALGESGEAFRGRALYFLGRYEEALELLVAKDKSLVLLRVECFRALGRMEDADALLPKIAEHFGEHDARYRLLLGRQLLREERAPEAIIEFRAVLLDRPLEPEALFGLGRALLKSGAREDGLAALERHRTLMPLLDALDFAQRGVALAPTRAGNQAALADAWIDLVAFDSGAQARAEAAFKSALGNASSTEFVAITLRVARFRVEVKNDLISAVDLLEASLARVDDVRLRVRAADYLQGRHEWQRARAHLEAALEARPKDRAILARLDKLAAQERSQ